MIRILASIVFAFSILAASSAHASMTPKSLENTQAEQSNQSSADCGAAARAFVINPTPLCKASSHKKTGSVRCQVDIAPLTATGKQFAAPSHSAIGLSALNTPKGWLCAPIIGPPRRA